MHWQRPILANAALVSVSTLYKGASVSSQNEMCLYSYLKVVSNLFKRVSFYSPCLFLYSVQSGARNLKPFGGCSRKHAFPYLLSGIPGINHTDNILPLSLGMDSNINNGTLSYMGWPLLSFLYISATTTKRIDPIHLYALLSQ